MSDTPPISPAKIPGVNPDLATPANEFVSLDTNQIAELRDFFLNCSKRLADASEKGLLLVYIVAFINISSIALFQWYLIVLKGYSWLWMPVPLVILAIPLIVLRVYHRILRAVAALPTVIAETADDAIDSVSGYKKELAELNTGELTLLKRWKSYIFFGKVMWKFCQVSDNTAEAFATAGLLGLMINPIFWIVLLVCLIVSFAFSAFLILICGLHFLVF